MESAEQSKFGITICLRDFSQKTFEQYQLAVIKASRAAFVQFSETTNDGVSATAYVRGETVREAIRHEIVSGLEIKEVDDLKPYVVSWLANVIQVHVKNVTTAPPDPN